jgi:quinol monooxygenase YgiN
MRLAFSLLLALVLASFAPMSTAHAQDSPVYVVSYIEVAPQAARPAAGLLRKLASASRKDEGNTRFDILQRAAHRNQLVIVSSWKDQKAYDAHMASAHVKEFRDRIKPDLISLIDDRTHTGMEIADAPGGKISRGAVYVVTHVDRTTSRWSRSGGTCGRTTITSPRRTPRNFGTR